MIPPYELNDSFFLIQKFYGHCKWVKKKKKVEYAISKASLNFSASGTAVEEGKGSILVCVCECVSVQCVCIYDMEITELEGLERSSRDDRV